MWLLANWDTLLALSLSVVFGILGIVGGASDDAVRGATLGVLALLAVAVIRARGTAPQLAALQSSVDAVLAIEQGAPWRVLDSELIYDMESRKLATYTKRRRLEFYRSRVLTMDDWFVGEGWSDNETCSPGSFVADPQQPGKPLRIKIGQLEYNLIVFPTFYKRGDTETVTIERTMHESFPSSKDEYVMLEVLDSAERARLKVIWPRGAEPTRVQVQGRSMPNQPVPLTALTSEPDGRKSYAYDITQATQGDNVYIFWDW